MRFSLLHYLSFILHCIFYSFPSVRDQIIPYLLLLHLDNEDDLVKKQISKNLHQEGVELNKKTSEQSLHCYQKSKATLRKTKSKRNK